MGSKKHYYQYAVEDHDESFDNATKFDSGWGPDFPDYIAEDAAEYEFSNRDGWEATWPLTFRLWDMDGKKLGVFEVEQEAVPSFNTSRKNEEVSDVD